jgi:hypothetical protein
MCAPAAVLLAAGSAGIGAVGSIYGGIAKKNAANYNASIADQNAQSANAQASDAFRRGEQDTAAHYIELGQLEGKQRAAYGGGGVELGFGSPVDVIAGTAAMGEADAGRLRENAAREAEGYRIQSLNFRQQAAGLRAEGKTAFMSGLLGVTGSILGGASQIAGMKGPKLAPAT